MSFNITPVASGYQEIHPYSAMNIASVKIKTSPILMMRISLREWFISATNHLGPEGVATSPMRAMPNAHVFGGGSNEGSPTHPQKHGHWAMPFRRACFIYVPDIMLHIHTRWYRTQSSRKKRTMVKSRFLKWNRWHTHKYIDANETDGIYTYINADQLKVRDRATVGHR